MVNTQTDSSSDDPEEKNLMHSHENKEDNWEAINNSVLRKESSNRRKVSLEIKNYSINKSYSLNKYLILILLCGICLLLSEYDMTVHVLNNYQTLKFIFIGVSSALLCSTFCFLIVEILIGIYSIFGNTKFPKLVYKNNKNDNDSKERENYEFILIIAFIHGFILGAFLYYIELIEGIGQFSTTQNTEVNTNSTLNFTNVSNSSFIKAPSILNNTMDLSDVIFQLYVFSIPLEIGFGGFSGYIFQYVTKGENVYLKEYSSIYTNNNYDNDL